MGWEELPGGWYAAAFVLAGGQSRRMGQDKALLVLGGETLVERGLRVLGEVCPEVAIAGGASELGRFGRVIPDTEGGLGPLAGIVAALEQSAADWNLFLAVDMPFVPVGALRSLLSAAGGEDLVVLAQAGERVQPLCGVYSRRGLPVLREELAAGRLKMKDAAAATGACAYLQLKHEGWFRNLNTPEDYRSAAGIREPTGLR